MKGAFNLSFFLSSSLKPAFRILAGARVRFFILHGWNHGKSAAGAELPRLTRSLEHSYQDPASF